MCLNPLSAISPVGSMLVGKQKSSVSPLISPALALLTRTKKKAKAQPQVVTTPGIAGPSPSYGA